LKTDQHENAWAYSRKGHWFYPREDVESTVYKGVLEESGQIMYQMRAAHLLAVCVVKVKLLAILKAIKLAIKL
jgi:hypothetical protein